MIETQFIVYFGHPFAPPNQYSVYRCERGGVGKHVATHRNLDAMRVVIPGDYYMAPYKQEMPVVEVWVHNSVPKP